MISKSSSYNIGDVLSYLSPNQVLQLVHFGQQQNIKKLQHSAAYKIFTIYVELEEPKMINYYKFSEYLKSYDGPYPFLRKSYVPPSIKSLLLPDHLGDALVQKL